MLNEYNGYFLGILSALIAVPLYYKRTKARPLPVGRCLLLLMLIFFITKHVTYIIFPLPVQRSVVQSGIHETENFIIPFSQLKRFYENSVLTSEMSFGIFTKEYLIAVWIFCAKIIPIGLFAKLFLRYNLKHFVIFSLGCILIFELLKILCNLITTVNYISLVSEHILYSFLSMLLGFILYYPILWISRSLRKKSDIMDMIYHLLNMETDP